MRRIEPAFPDLVTVSHRLGSGPPAAGSAYLDPVEMRLVWRGPAKDSRGERVPPRKPVPFLVHAACARNRAPELARLVAAGCGVMVVLDGQLDPDGFPAPSFAGQVVALTPWLPTLWGRSTLAPLEGWRRRGAVVGTLVALGPSREPREEVWQAVRQTRDAGGEFVVAVPLALPPEDRHRVYDAVAGEDGDGALEDLLFHTDLGQVLFELEREASRACRKLGVAEGLPGPATSAVPRAAVSASATLLLWARRLDLLDGVGSLGWQLRRAARALVASGRDPDQLVAEDNLRIVPGFTPWVEAFARSAWGDAGEPFEEFLARWLAH